MDWRKKNLHSKVIFKNPQAMPDLEFDSYIKNLRKKGRLGIIVSEDDETGRLNNPDIAKIVKTDPFDMWDKIGDDDVDNFSYSFIPPKSTNCIINPYECSANKINNISWFLDLDENHNFSPPILTASAENIGSGLLTSNKNLGFKPSRIQREHQSLIDLYSKYSTISEFIRALKESPTLNSAQLDGLVKYYQEQTFRKRVDIDLDLFLQEKLLDHEATDDTKKIILPHNELIGPLSLPNILSPVAVIYAAPRTYQLYEAQNIFHGALQALDQSQNHPIAPRLYRYDITYDEIPDDISLVASGRFQLAETAFKALETIHQYRVEASKTLFIVHYDKIREATESILKIDIEKPPSQQMEAVNRLLNREKKAEQNKSPNLSM